jgi:hypothetical protein
MFTLSLLLAAAMAPADAPTTPPAAAVSDAGELQGEWEICSRVEVGGNRPELFKGDRFVFDGPGVRMCNAVGRVPSPLLSVRVDAASDPPFVDLVWPDGSRCRSAYRRTGDELVWTWDQNGVVVWTLRRVRKRRPGGRRPGRLQHLRGGELLNRFRRERPPNLRRGHRG